MARKNKNAGGYYSNAGGFSSARLKELEQQLHALRDQQRRDRYAARRVNGTA